MSTGNDELMNEKAAATYHDKLMSALENDRTLDRGAKFIEKGGKFFYKRAELNRVLALRNTEGA